MRLATSPRRPPAKFSTKRTLRRTRDLLARIAWNDPRRRRLLIAADRMGHRIGMLPHYPHYTCQRWQRDRQIAALYAALPKS